MDRNCPEKGKNNLLVLVSGSVIHNNALRAVFAPVHFRKSSEIGQGRQIQVSNISIPMLRFIRLKLRGLNILYTPSNGNDEQSMGRVKKRVLKF